MMFRPGMFSYFFGTENIRGTAVYVGHPLLCVGRSFAEAGVTESPDDFIWRCRSRKLVHGIDVDRELMKPYCDLATMVNLVRWMVPEAVDFVYTATILVDYDPIDKSRMTNKGAPTTLELLKNSTRLHIGEDRLLQHNMDHVVNASYHDYVQSDQPGPGFTNQLLASLLTELCGVLEGEDTLPLFNTNSDEVMDLAYRMQHDASIQNVDTAFYFTAHSINTLLCQGERRAILTFSVDKL